MRTNDRTITDLMKAVQSGAAQLPDFQRGWVWDDSRIKALIASIIHNYPVGAAMFLTYGNPEIQFKYKPIEGAVVPSGVVPSELILDGQQRLTSIFNALYSDKPVHTKTDKGKEIDRYYYIDIEKALDPSAENEEIILSVPDTRIVTGEFGRDVLLDLSTPQKEYQQKRMPLNLILDSSKWQLWQSEYYTYYQYTPEITKQFMDFTTRILIPVSQYQMPVIVLDKDTPKEAVCQVFENVNTGGVSLTVFELVTAVYAMDSFPLREDWSARKEKYLSGDVISGVTSTDFLTALTLLSSYKSGGPVKCKKNSLTNFLQTHDDITLLVDCENSDPYKLCAMFDFLREMRRQYQKTSDEAECRLGSIRKIILFDDFHTIDAWDILEDYVHVPVVHEEVERVLGHKSLVDIAMSVGACKEHLVNRTNSFMIAASDSDYWGLIRALSEADFMVLAERSKFSPETQRFYDEHGVNSCLIDDFAGNLNPIKEGALRCCVEKHINNLIAVNILDTLNETHDMLRLDMSTQEKMSP